MDLRVKHSSKTRIEAARLFDAGFGYISVAKDLGLSVYTSRNWRDRHVQNRLLNCEVMGNKHYSSAVKIASVEEFLAGASKTEVLTQFDISTRAVFDKWVATYRKLGPEGLLPKPKGRPAKAVRVGPESLEEEVLRLRMEVAVLKKLEALMIQGDPRLWEKPSSSNR